MGGQVKHEREKLKRRKKRERQCAKKEKRRERKERKSRISKSQSLTPNSRRQSYSKR